VASRSSWRGWVLRLLVSGRISRGRGRWIPLHRQGDQHTTSPVPGSHAAALLHMITTPPLKVRVGIDTHKKRRQLVSAQSRSFITINCGWRLSTTLYLVFVYASTGEYFNEILVAMRSGMTGRHGAVNFVAACTS
ncbi:unnamed protein product, partial [Ectocarpus sp. 12 AP-2014]